MIISRRALIVMAVFSGLIALASFRFVFLGLDISFPDMADHISQRRWLFLTHVTFAPVALLLGSVQFFPAFRTRFRGAHRWIGRGYGISVGLSGIAGILIAPSASGGISAYLGFAALSLIWLLVTFRAVQFALQRDFVAHRRWMIRSFALTFAGVTLRLYLVGFVLTGYTYAEAATFLAWLCWVPNVFVAEWVIRKNQG